MPYCPRCSKKLTKNKTKKIYSCVRHGFVRNTLTYVNYFCNMTDKEFFDTKKENDIEK